MNMHEPGFTSMPIRGVMPGENVNRVGHGDWQTVSAEVPPVAPQEVPTSSTFEGTWYPSVIDSTHISLTPGFIYDGVTSHFPSVSSIAVHATALRYIYLVCSLTSTTVDGFVTGGTVDATPTVSAYSSTQTNTNTTAYILLLTWQAGAVVQRYAYWNLACQLRNINTGDVSFQYWVCS